jgi:hypothetical protein
MTRRLSAPVLLATFTPDVGAAVVAVLAEHGLPAALAAQGQDAPGGEVAVLVEAALRDESLAVLSAAMDDVVRRSREGPAGVPGGAWQDPVDAPVEPDELETRPLVLERLRRFGGLAMVLIPALVLTLQAPPVTRPYALVVLIGGLVLLSALRDRYRGQR